MEGEGCRVVGGRGDKAQLTGTFLLPGPPTTLYPSPFTLHPPPISGLVTLEGHARISPSVCVILRGVIRMPYLMGR